MPSSVRPRGGSTSNRGVPATPMSERQQLALLMQMTSGGNESGSRSPSSGAGTSRSRERNERGWTPLHEACNHGWYDVAYRLVHSGANVNAKGLDNETPLHDAVLNGHVRLIKLLVERGADIHAKNSKGKTPLDVASPSIQPYLLNPQLPLPESTGSSRLQPRSRDDKKAATSEGGGGGKQKGGSTPSASASSSGTQPAGDEPMDTSATTGTGGGNSKQSSNTGSSATVTTPTSTASTSSAGAAAEDVYEFKTSKEGDGSPEAKTTAGGSAAASGTTAGENSGEIETDAADAASVPVSAADEQGPSKRSFAESNENQDEGGNDDESRRKKRKDEGGKEGKVGGPRSAAAGKGQGGKQAGGAQGKAASLNVGKAAAVEKKSPCSSPKPSASTSDAELEDGKNDLKVPPLKIVIPQSGEPEATSRNGKNSSQRVHQALPYVVPISSGEGGADMAGGTASPEAGAAGGGGPAAKGEEKKEGGGTAGAPADEQRGSHQRVLRSSHRGGANTDRGSNNSSPQLQRSHSPSPTASPAASTSKEADAPPSSSASTGTTSKTSETQANQNNDPETSSSSSSSTANSSAATPTPTPAVELHPRKRKMKPSKDGAATSAAAPAEAAAEPTEAPIHPHEQPITNCYQLFLNIRKQIDKRRRGIYPVQPKPPQGFKDYLMNRCTYVLNGTTPATPKITFPPTLPHQMKDLFTEQEKERYRLRMQHVIEKEKLVLSVEQEILRVHGRAARALANQSLPFSVCTILKDEEVYNLITPEQEEKDRNARSRYNGRLFLSWLQDVDDKWEKIKEHMLLRHHNEAESLHAVQKMDWEWKMKELNLCDRKSTPAIDEHHVPMVHVSDDFDLLPA